MSQRTTLLLSSTRSYATLAKAVLIINENLYGNELFAADRIEFKDVYDKDGSLSHFEIVGTPTDFFQLGLRYGAMEEAKLQQRIFK
jgi:hypothetical protein